MSQKISENCGLSVANSVSNVPLCERALYGCLTVTLLILYIGKHINFVFSFLYMYVSSYPSWVASFFKPAGRPGCGWLIAGRGGILLRTGL